MEFTAVALLCGVLLLLLTNQLLKGRFSGAKLTLLSSENTTFTIKSETQETTKVSNSTGTMHPLKWKR